MSALVRAGARVFEALTAVCVVACLLSGAAGSVWWMLAFAVLAFLAYEAGGIADEASRRDADWYSSQPIPARLALALTEPLTLSQIANAHPTRADAREMGIGYVEPTRMDRAHARHVRELLR